MNGSNDYVQALRLRQPVLWINTEYSNGSSDLTIGDISDASARLERFSCVLLSLFPELQSAGG
jgi:D-serine dehydratase